MIRGTVAIDITVCKGCELCIAACPQESLGLAAEINVIGYRYTALVQDNCTGCINCALVCPEGAINVYREPKMPKKEQELSRIPVV